MRTAFIRLTQQVVAPFRADGSFKTRFDDAEQMRQAARAFESHGCEVRRGWAKFSLVVTPPWSLAASRSDR